MTINEYQELAMTTLNPELSKREILITQLSQRAFQVLCKQKKLI